MKLWHRGFTQLRFLTALSLILIIFGVSMAPASAASYTAYDMVGSSSQNLISYTNTFTDAFSSAADGFQKYQRGVSPSIPYAVLDDSLSIYTGDNLGIIKEGNTDEFFGATDTQNGDNSGPVTATWVFDISGGSGLQLSIDMGAMGDFESSDYFTWTYSIDGGAVETAFESTVDEADSYTYILEGGSSYTLSDPMLMQGTILTDDLQTFSAPINGTGSELTLVLTLQTDGGSEGMAFQNIILESVPVAYDMVESSSQNLISYTNSFTDAFSSAADGFQKYQRGVSPSIPYAVLDDSLSIYTGDNLGIIKEGNTDEFFGATDTQNGDNSGPVTATWVFDISGGSGLQLSIDMGAMGDFESSDYFTWTYSIDGGAVETAFESTVDEADSYTYILEGGSSYTLSDPMLMQGTILTDDLQTFSAPINGTGSELTLVLTLQTDGGSEGMAFQNIVIGGGGGDVEPPDDLSNVCGAPYTATYEIQGSGFSTPLSGEEVATEGVVVGIFDDFNGFFIQDTAGDGDPNTSDGLFVYAPGMTGFDEGDLFRVLGTAGEYSDRTQVTADELVECATGNTITPTDLNLPLTAEDALETSEGMLVTFPQDLVIAEYFEFDRYGSVVLSSDRMFQPTAVFQPDSPDAGSLAAANLLDRLTLDDGRSSQNPDPAIHPNGSVFDLNNLFRGGDTLTNLTGILDYSFGLYRLQPTMGADYTPVNLRTAQPDDVGGGIKVASFNVLNYFTTLGSRGADTPEEFTRQRAKIIAALTAIDADVVGLIEIENNTDAIQDLVNGLNDVLGAGTYNYVDTGVIGTDEIKVAFIYKPATVSLVGDYAVLDELSFVDPANTGSPKNRPALAQTFIDDTTGGIFTAVVNHLKSKGSECGAGDDDPLQGSCNLTRTLAAQVLADWLATDPTGSSDGDFLIMGDLNAYDKEDPIDTLLSNGYADMVFEYLGEYAYSYVFDGQLGYLDHTLVNADLQPEVSGLTIWHINADEPDLIDYDMTYKEDAQDALYAADPYRSSDHDPVITGLNVCDEIAPTLSVSASTTELWPANHKYVTVTFDVTASDNFDTSPTVTLLSVTSDEPDEGLGDGDTEDDIVILDDFTIDLRAERSGNGDDGRTYTVTYLVEDACGNQATASIQIFVPQSQGKK